MYNKHHSKAETDRICLKRKKGERGLLQIKAAFKAEIINKFVNIVEGQE